ncbi:MAG: HD domain-containing protein [Deltaproteobacteria bacterium]|nr:HD domain-containing protein [Candidatus Zymogenaceae bacterium]
MSTLQDEKQRKQSFIRAMKILNAAISSLKLYSPNHPSVSKSLDDLFSIIQALIDDKDRIVIAVTRNIPILDGIPVYESDVAIQSFVKMMQQRGIELIIIKSKLKQEELVPFLNILRGDKQTLTSENLTLLLEQNRVKNILIKDVNFNQRAKEAYFDAIGSISRVLDDVQHDNVVNIFESKRSVKGMINSILVDKNILLSLSMIKNFDDYLFSHSVNVCILSISLAEELNYGEDELTDIGMAGLLHDIGKIKTSLEVLQKPGKLNEEEWELMRQHPQLGADLLKEQEGLSEKTIRIVLEHHMRPNGKGYPQYDPGREPLTQSQIVAIADTYDAATTIRPYQEPLSCTGAIKLMRQMSRETSEFDRNMLASFEKMMGGYPIGTTVRLDTNEIGYVTRYGSKKEAPMVKIFLDRAGQMLNEPKEVDLNEKDMETGKPFRNIIDEVDPIARNLDLNRILES